MGKLGYNLKSLDADVRKKLDEIKRQEVHRLKELMEQKAKLKNS